MCGIAGIIGPNSSSYKEALNKMTSKMSYRGPDALSFECFSNAALAHLRLSIIDLSEKGNQPMFSDTKKQCIVLNGEIYGYQKLKKEYANYPYSNKTDTEVILAMYQEKKEDLLKELPGMFAFALWDEEEQSLFCARDRFGEKPFYYAIGENGEFIFASELKAILASNLLKPKINKQAIYHYLKYGYINPQQTIFTNIHALEPGHFLIYTNGKINTQKYWEIPTTDFNIGIDNAIEQFNDLLDKAIESQLIADVPVGSFLSGGLDSSTIVAKASKYVPNITTIAYGYDSDLSELKYAREIAVKYNTNHIEIKEKEINLLNSIREYSKYLDQPYCDLTFVPTYLICKSAAKELKVILSGDVGDELFGGYHFYTVEKEIKEHRIYKRESLKYLLKMASKFKQFSYITQMNLKHPDILDFHMNAVRNFFTDNEIESLGIEERFYQNFGFQPQKDSLNDIMRVDILKYVPGNMLMKADQMSMANSLEVRTPFLDKNFAEFCIQLPDSLKVNSINDKYILREACQSLWTEEIRKRRKQGFGVSYQHYFNDKEFLDYSDSVLNNSKSRVYEFINYNSKEMFMDRDKKQMNITMLNLWLENYKEYLP